MSGGLGVALREELLRAAEPVAREARARAAKWPGVSTGTIGPRVGVSGAFVTQRKRKVTGDHPNIGALQMTEAMIPALEHNIDTVQEGAERALTAIEKLGGF